MLLLLASCMALAPAPASAADGQWYTCTYNQSYTADNVCSTSESGALAACKAEVIARYNPLCEQDGHCTFSVSATHNACVP